jgi:hypothetical protein
MEPGSIVIIGTILAGLFTLVASLDKDREKIWRFFVFTGVVIGGYGGWETLKLQKVQKKLQENFQTERLNYERELRTKADEIATLNREIMGSVTGGDSFAFLAFQITPKTNDAIVYLVCRGKHPCFDAFVTVFDGQKMRDLRRRQGLQGGGFITNQQLREGLKLISKFTMPIVRPETSTLVRDNWLLPADRNSVTYYIGIEGRNGGFSQLFKLRRVGGSWKQAFQVVKYSYSKDGKFESKVLNEHTDHDFPPKERDFVW